MSRNIYFFCIILLLLCSVLSGTDISEREKELQNMQRQIEQQKKMMQEAEAKRKSAEQSKQQTQRQLSTTQSRLQELSRTQANLRQSLENTQQMVSHTENKLEQVNSTINKAVVSLLLADQSDTKLRKAENDAHLLTLYTQNLIYENQKIAAERERVLGETKAKEEEINTMIATLRTEQSRLATINQNLTKIESEISTFERQKRDYQRKANELEGTAKALQDLINQLKIEAENAKQTYVFAHGVEAPVRGRIITQFGPKRHERYNIQTMSNGVDIAVPENTIVKALSDGEVVYADWFTGSGRMLIIDHKNGFHSIYAFNNELLVKKGDMVKKGQHIAQSGKTGTATEPSLRFEIRRNGVAINPLDVVRFQ